MSQNIEKVTHLDANEFELPETIFVRHIEDRVFQGIILQALSTIEGISLIGGNYIDHLLGRKDREIVRGIHAEQDNKRQCIAIRVELDIAYGISIPEKAEEIQSELAKIVSELTGLHVSTVHVIFHDIMTKQPKKDAS